MWILSPDGKPITTDPLVQLHLLGLQYGHWTRRIPGHLLGSAAQFYRHEIESLGLQVDPGDRHEARHAHVAAETSVLLDGTCRYTVWEGAPQGPGYQLTLAIGDLLVIPAGRFHRLEADGLRLITAEVPR